MNETVRTRHLLACLGDASRFRLVLCLVEATRCASDLALDVGLSQSCTTRHLQAMERAGIVSGARYGKRVLFRLRREEVAVDALIQWALRHGAEIAEAPRREGRGPAPRCAGRRDGRAVAPAGPARPARGRNATRPPRHAPRGRSNADVVFDVAFDHGVAGPPLAEDASTVARSPSPVDNRTSEVPSSPAPPSARDDAGDSTEGDRDAPGGAASGRNDDLPDYLL